MSKNVNFSSTQDFTEIFGIIDDVALFTNGHAVMVIEVGTTNFALLSPEEQDGKIDGYASFLNSLATPLQILVVSKKVDISVYLNYIDEQISQNIHNEQAGSYMRAYKQFITELVKNNTVLDKRFYIVIPHASYESGSIIGKVDMQQFFMSAKTALETKTAGIRGQLGRLSLQTKILQESELTALFKQMYGREKEQKEEEKPANSPLPA